MSSEVRAAKVKGVFSFKKLYIMYYEVFPFGKYKGVKLNQLPSTYIVLALEQFELPTELINELSKILLGRLKVYSILENKVKNQNKKDFLEWIISSKINYEMPF
jgi:uncharacterized protein (DUF3820 family)